jgi:hypothetical protein
MIIGFILGGMTVITALVYMKYKGITVASIIASIKSKLGL